MATRILPFAVAVAPGTTKAAPWATPLALDGWVIERLDLEVPKGPAGLMGFQIYQSGVPWIPYGPGQWIVWDNVKDTYYLEDQPVASGWSLVAYNLGFFPHTITLRFHVSAPTVETPTPTLPTIVQSAPPTTEAMIL